MKRADLLIPGFPLSKKNKTPKNRVFKEKGLSGGFPAALSDQICDKVEKKAFKEAKKKSEDISLGRSYALEILQTKKSAHFIYKELDEAKLPMRPAIVALVSIAKKLVPGDPATVGLIASLSGIPPDNFPLKWWRDKLPELLDGVGITVKKSKTERVFCETQELKIRCRVMSRMCYSLGNAVFNTCDRALRPLVDNSAYAEKSKSGELVIHPRPYQTEEGKEAKRDADLADYLHKQRARKARHENAKDDSFDFGMGVFEDYKYPILIAIAVTALLVGYAASNDDGGMPESMKAAMIEPQASDGEMLADLIEGELPGE